MHIFNAMFGRGLGGIEQSFLDYNKALTLKNNQVTALIHPNAQIAGKLQEFIDNSPDASGQVNIERVLNHGQWDSFAVHKLRKLIKKNKPDAIIAHGNRAIALFTKAAHNLCPVIGLAHNYKIKRLLQTDAAFTITKDLKEKVTSLGKSTDCIFHIPNMLTLPDKRHHSRPFRNPPVIGAMGRFVSKKGFHSLLYALSHIKKEGLPFTALIGGDGEEKPHLQQLVIDLGLEDHVTFTGWIEDKESFLSEIDIFCLPSLHEAFGIVLLEAWSHALPIVTTDAEGPMELVTDSENACLVPRDNPEGLAQGLLTLLRSPKVAASMGQQGNDLLYSLYAIDIVSQKIQNALETIVSDYKE